MNAPAGEERLFNRTYLSLFLINMIVSASFSMVATTISLYVTGFGETAAVAGTVVGVLSVASLCVRPFSGILSDQLNRKLLLTVSLLGISLAMAGCGLTRSVPLLIAFRVLHGLSFSIATTVTMALVAGSVPQAKMAQGLGYFAVGQTITAAFAPSLGIWLGESFGFSITFLSASVLILMALALAMFIVPSQGKKHFRLGHRLTVADFISREALPFGILAIVVSGATGLENSFVALYGQQLSMGNVGWYFTIGAVALFISRLSSGKLADKHAAPVIYAGLGMMSAAFVLLGIASVGSALIIFAAAAMLKALGLGAVQPTLQASSMRSVPVERRGAASCTYYLGADIGQAVTPVLGGVIAGVRGYPVMFMLFALPQLIGIGFYVWLRHRRAV
ncbi:MAG TPA: MFS transporter [Candidatus Limiplasma sp.]|nr:MFS transporter [Candidatus Limiplasma sp.]